MSGPDDYWDDPDVKRVQEEMEAKRKADEAAAAKAAREKAESEKRADEGREAESGGFTGQTGGNPYGPGRKP